MSLVEGGRRLKQAMDVDVSLSERLFLHRNAEKRTLDDRSSETGAN